MEPPLKVVWSRAPRSSPFDALLEAAAYDAEAAEGLVEAYGALPEAERRALVDTVITDSRAAGRSPAPTLTLFLSAETSPSLIGVLAQALLREHETTSADVYQAWTWGSERDGGVALTRRGPAGPELVRVSWQAGELEGARVSALGQAEMTDHEARTLGLPDGADAVEWDAAVDRLAARLWHERLRQGSLPERLRPLAELFVAGSASHR
jgi:hypothetical protein